MLDTHTYTLRYKRSLVESIFAQLQRIDELKELVAWSKKKPKGLHNRYRQQLDEARDKLFWKTRGEQLLLTLTVCAYEGYRQIVQQPRNIRRLSQTYPITWHQRYLFRAIVRLDWIVAELSEAIMRLFISTQGVKRLPRQQQIEQPTLSKDDRTHHPAIGGDLTLNSATKSGLIFSAHQVQHRGS